MLRKYNVFYDGNFVCQVYAMHENSAIDKGCQVIGVSASAYSGKARRLVTAERV
jgi:hypothetical protein